MNEKENSVLEVALKYLIDFQFSVIPMGQDKHPLIPWSKYQKEKPTIDQVKAWFKKYPNANVGIVTGELSGICVVDIDSDKGKEEIQKYIPDSVECPTCKTPGGGNHLYFKCPSPALGNNTRIIPDCDLRGEGGVIMAPPSQNGNGKYYQWLPSLSIFDLTPPDLPTDYIAYISSSIKYARDSKNDAKKEPLFLKGHRNEDVFHVAHCLLKGQMPPFEMEQVVKNIGKNCNPPLTQKECEIIIESAIKRIEKKGRNLSQEVSEWILSTNGHFLSTDVHNCLQVSTREDKKNVSEILRRHIEDGIIERYGEKNGCFRKVDMEAPDIDFVHADEKPLYFKWPFGIEQYFNLMKKNVVIVAGEADAGKTAFLLNVVKMNMDRNKVYYFSSEMGPSEFKSRMMNFDCPLDAWHFHPKERSINFHDVVRPNDINIIDYMEISNDFYQIGGWIRQIFDKLENGIAIIAIQKPRGRDEARGGEITKEKARLYLSMGSGKIKIVKAKNWVHPQINPNGLELDFKLVNGCNFFPKETWQKPLK